MAYSDSNLQALSVIFEEQLDPLALVLFQVRVLFVGADCSWCVVGRVMDVAWVVEAVDEATKVVKSSFDAVVAVAEDMRLEELGTEDRRTWPGVFALGAERTCGVGHDLATKLPMLEN